MAAAYQVGEELNEETRHQKAYVHTVNIGIRGDDNLVVAQIIHILVDIERRLQKVELLILVDHLLRQTV